MKMERLFRKRLLQHILKHSFSIQGSSLHSIILVITSWLMSLKSLSSLSDDESVHGTYIGYKFQLGFNELPEEEQESFREWMYDLLYQLYENEELYTKSLYDGVGWTEEVMTFLRYNANKALMKPGTRSTLPR